MYDVFLWELHPEKDKLCIRKTHLDGGQPTLAVKDQPTAIAWHITRSTWPRIAFCSIKSPQLAANGRRMKEEKQSGEMRSKSFMKSIWLLLYTAVRNQDYSTCFCWQLQCWQSRCLLSRKGIIYMTGGGGESRGTDIGASPVWRWNVELRLKGN